MIQEDKREMSTPLEHWQERLERHYKALAKKRDGSVLPLFAFEHGLSVEETERIGKLLRAHLRAGRERLEKYWLLWVVYATEFGYDYTGDEYWQSFEELTPGWELHYRYSLARWFKKFQANYHGFIPTGPWAEHFSNIAWPITHAILPKYLQYQFASALYQQRYRLAGLTTFDSASVGRLLAAHTHHATTRFEKFLQQEELTGRIVLALLGQSPQDGHEPIYPKTLVRIVADLDKVRRTRQWLRDTRQTVTDRFSGIGQGTGPSARATRSFIRDGNPSVQPDIRPSLLLRYSGAGKWAVALEVPSFAPLAALHPDLRAFLKRTRCRLAGGTDTKPAGWTLSGNRIGILKSWPDEDKPLLTFLQSHDTLDRLLLTDCRLSSGPNWLFRIGADGRAREIRGLNVHPGTAYILVSTQELDPPDNSFFAVCALECDDVYAVRINVPESLSTEETNQLKALGLEVVRTVRVWPAGLPCRSWDGEGQSEWLTTEQPQFGIVNDHPVQSYLVRLDEKMQISIDAPDSGEPVFVRLDPLPVGRHRVTVTALRRTTSSANNQPLIGYVDLKVREPEPWVPGVPTHTGLVVNISPHDANLDEFWANTVDLSISGPENHSVTCTLSLETSSGERILSKQIGQAFNLPVSPMTWHKQFSRFLEEHEEAGWDYLEASSGTLTIQAGELGQYLLRFDRNVVPVRWITRRRHGQIELRLIDDTGLENNTTCHLFRMDHPTRAESLEVSELLAGISPEPPGGLFCARNGDHGDEVIISNFAAGDGLNGLGVTPVLTDIENGSTSVVYALRVLTDWINARSAGPVAGPRCAKVVKEIQHAIYAKLCGQNWAKAEAAFIENPNSIEAAQVLQNRVSRKKGFWIVLERDYARFEKSTIAIQWYCDLARRFGVCSDSAICEFAVRLAIEPHVLSSLYGDDLVGLVHKAISHTEVLRGARYAALLLSERGLGDESGTVGKMRAKWH